ncbi:hypothetical protein B0T26DRAFT_755603 [Lasiosphaeria miniovina]|uniref:Uncharacterized protein n=1 Tax=Lasiosphaeria miniovina TaxID=1954250 RepID=A0AA39ZYR7_9PEZI|nr:uncharacterized protein B0T26DRAFT_755603 [Lasiosphaeria miniovina]KAK0706065.1 hypothetical protein B0T26DRAFT_755603 [Lasiosphaeria miniovina]
MTTRRRPNMCPFYTVGLILSCLGLCLAFSGIAISLARTTARAGLDATQAHISASTARPRSTTTTTVTGAHTVTVTTTMFVSPTTPLAQAKRDGTIAQQLNAYPSWLIGAGPVVPDPTAKPALSIDGLETPLMAAKLNDLESAARHGGYPFEWRGRAFAEPDHGEANMNLAQLGQQPTAVAEAEAVITVTPLPAVLDSGDFLKKRQPGSWTYWDRNRNTRDPHKSTRTIKRPEGPSPLSDYLGVQHVPGSRGNRKIDKLGHMSWPEVANRPDPCKRGEGEDDCNH